MEDVDDRYIAPERTGRAVEVGVKVKVEGDVQFEEVCVSDAVEELGMRVVGG